MIKYQIFKNLLRQTAASYNNVKRDIFADVWGILMKFGKMISDQKFENFQNPRWQTPAIWKIKKITISA